MLVSTGVAGLADAVGIAVAGGTAAALGTAAVGEVTGAVAAGTGVAEDDDGAADGVLAVTPAGAVVGTVAGRVAQAQSRTVGAAMTKPRRVQRRADIGVVNLFPRSPRGARQAHVPADDRRRRLGRSDHIG